MPKFNHAIVIGASSGIGAALAEILARDGCMVAVLGRRMDCLRALAEGFPGLILPFAHDVTNTDEIPPLFQEVTKQLGGLDLVVYSSGVMPEVGPHEFDFEKDRQMIEVNLLGAICWINQAAIRFEHVGHGYIAGIGSVAGDRGRAGQPVYNTSKAALATYLEALRNRLSRHGVCVATFKPGPTATEMTEGLHLRGAMPVEQAAQIIFDKADRNGEHYLKATHRVMFYVIKRIPSWLFRRLHI